MAWRRTVTLCLVALSLSLVQGRAQTPGDEHLRSPILTVDRDRLFTRSRMGQRIIAALEVETQALAAENRGIEAQLADEEQVLTQRRAGMDPAAFRALAAAFDEKVVGIRAAQDEKVRELSRKREIAQQQFYQDVLPILTEIIRERGAVMVLENRIVFLAAQQVDITAEAIERIDAQAGTDQTPDASVQPQDPQQ